MAKNSFFTPEDELRIIEAIQKAEQQTSGEIKVHVEAHCYVDLLDRTTEVFALLKMHETEQRNGALIYMAIEDHLFALIGDMGINAVVPEDFWDEARDIMEENFRAGKIVGGLEGGIAKIGEKLQAFFPYKTDDKNELPDDISYG